jgi:hypothetical protein
MHSDGSNDTLIEAYNDSVAGGPILIQRIQAYHSAPGLDSAIIWEDFNGSFIPLVQFQVHRDGQGNADSISVNIRPAAGILLPVQSIIFHHTGTRLDSMSLFDRIGNSLDQKIAVRNNANGLVERLDFLVENVDGEWVPAVRYFFQSSSSVGSAENTLGQDITLFPNPAEALLKLNSINEIETYKLVSPAGQVIQEGAFNTLPYQIDLSALPQGNYYLELSLSSGRRLTKQILKK